jgi:hypothetical protein
MTDAEQLLRVHGAPPAHAPGFEDRLWAAIEADERQDERPRAKNASTAAVPFARRHARLLASLAAAAAAAAIVVGVVVSGQTVHELRYPPEASAAVVAANVRAALADVRTLSAERTESYRTVKGPPQSEWQEDWTTADWWARARIGDSATTSTTARLLVTADGRWRMDSPESLDPPVIVDQYTADEATGVMKTYWPSDRTLYVTRDASLGPPDTWTGDYALGWPVDVSFIRPANLQAMAGGVVGETTHEGRPALTVSCTVTPVPIVGLNMDSHLFDTVEYTVDRETWLILRTSYLLRGQMVWQLSLKNVRVDVPLRDAEFELSPSSDTNTEIVTDSDALPLSHFRRVSFGEAAHAFSTSPLEPRVLPDGFQPFAAAVSPKAEFMYWTSTDGYQPHYWPPGRDVTQLSYRAGLLRFVVTTREQPSGGPPPADPFVADPFVTQTAGDDLAHIGGTLETVTISGGACRGVTGYVVTPLLAPPHLWAWHDSTLVTVGGDLTRDELLEVANSLRRMD